MRRKFSETEIFSLPPMFQKREAPRSADHIYRAFLPRKHSQQALRKYIHSVTYLRCLLGGKPPKTPCAYKIFLSGKEKIKSKRQRKK